MYFVIVTDSSNQSAVHRYVTEGEALRKITKYYEKGQAASLAKDIPVKVKVTVEIEE